MAKNPTVATPPTPNPKLADYLKAGGPSAKPRTVGRKRGGGLPTNKAGRKR
jgi:hypothetical protein